MTVDKPDGVLYRRPWELTSETLAQFRIEDADQEPQWHAPMPVVNDPYAMVPPMYGYRTEELGVTDILVDGVYTKLADPRNPANVGYLDDWSGQNGGYQGTERFNTPIPQGL